MLNFFEFLSQKGFEIPSTTESDIVIQKIIKNHSQSVKKILKKAIKAGWVSDDEVLKKDLLELISALRNNQELPTINSKYEPDVVERPSADAGHNPNPEE